MSDMKCRTCEQQKPEHEFSVVEGSAGLYRRRSCKVCERLKAQGRTPKPREPDPIILKDTAALWATRPLIKQQTYWETMGLWMLGEEP